MSMELDSIGIFNWKPFELLNLVHDSFPKYFLLGTEASNCPSVLIGDWSRGESYGYDIWGDLEAWAVGWVDWNLLLDPIGGPNHGDNWCDAQVIADAKTQKVYYQPTYYYMGHYSRYILPDSIRVSSTTDSLFLCTTAWLTPDNNVALVVMNWQDFGIDFKLNDGVYYATASIPAHSIQTYIYQKI